MADANVREGPDATLDFVVTLSRERTEATTVDYSTSDGTATAGADYTAASGTLTFAAGKTSKTVSVAVLDDAHDEGGVETLSLTLSNAEGAQIADTTAIGTIADDESRQPVEALTARFENVPESHDGSTAFTFEVHFSEEPAGLSYVTVRDGLFDVSGGTVTQARRHTLDSNLAFVVTVEPTTEADISIAVRGTDRATRCTPFAPLTEGSCLPALLSRCAYPFHSQCRSPTRKCTRGPTRPLISR